ncbi:lycopene cyclase family protein [Aquimarina sp. ERC-38]|uniref:lycopene cyclase family protein n=1 Tax=Aquimarina sp. ERC-38 TaxID=2949996 RepID=UPI002245B092|nr:lycopene cyclase family protein [Aquimarina sp. ERC-38]UZO82284.1 lycopene cyclase family protein [Aquimarina sp. ERC-38]
MKNVLHTTLASSNSHTINSKLIFDYAIIGMGVAGLKLAMEMKSDPFFSNKQILIVDAEIKNENDKTYCYWEYGEGHWDEIVKKSWKHIEVFDRKKNKQIKSIAPLVYKQINSIDFYNYCINALKKDDCFTFLNQNVLSVAEANGKCTLQTDAHKIISDYVFDSRVEEKFFSKKEDHLYIKQTFVGWFIKTDQPIFDPNTFTFMDFRLQWENSTSFTYILPTSTTEALVEFTLFANYRLEREIYEQKLEEYLNIYYPDVTYEIVEEEYPIRPVPMTAFDFDKNPSKKIIKIGIAAGWTKPSSGFTFKRSEKFIKEIIQNLKNEKPQKHVNKLIPWRFRYYDLLLLRVLKHQEHNGTKLFIAMFQLSKVNILFKFLDEETNLIEEFLFMIRLPKWPFIRAIFSKN